MKIGLSLFILIVLFLVSPVFAGKSVDLQDFEQFKQMLLPVMTKSVDPMQKTRKCVVNSTNSEQLNACVAIMASYQHEMMQGSVAGRSLPASKMPRLEWSRAITEQIRSDLDRSLRETSASINCMQSSVSHEAMAECMQKSK